MCQLIGQECYIYYFGKVKAKQRTIWKTWTSVQLQRFWHRICKSTMRGEYLMIPVDGGICVSDNDHLRLASGNWRIIKFPEVELFWWYEVKGVVPNVTISVILWVSRTNKIQPHWSVRGQEDTFVFSENVEQDRSEIKIPWKRIIDHIRHETSILKSTSLIGTSRYD